MKKHLLLFFLCCSVTNLFASQTFPVSDGTYIIPDSSIPANDAGSQMHTYIVIFKPNNFNSSGLPTDGETPASLACVYGLTTFVPGCPIAGTTALPTGGAGSAIAVVDAFDYDKAEDDLNTYSAAFGLPACTTGNGCFNVVYASGSKPPSDSSWADEHALDIEMAHAMAPNAKIFMVEAASGSDSDLMQAVDVASNEVLAATASTGGMAIVSNSWGNSETPDEAKHDVHFQKPGVVYLASSGDYSAPARYPSCSPYVISAGGSSIIRQNGMFVSQGAWNTEPGVPIGSKSGASGGPCQYESRPVYQNIISKMVGNARGTPDISFDSDPHTGVDVYSTNAGGWIKDGGTSAASPALAGVIASANHKARSTNEELTLIYNGYIKGYQSYWRDILSGNNGFPALAGYDFVTGLGTPYGYNGK